MGMFSEKGAGMPIDGKSDDYLNYILQRPIGLCFLYELMDHKSLFVKKNRDKPVCQPAIIEKQVNPNGISAAAFAQVGKSIFAKSNRARYNPRKTSNEHDTDEELVDGFVIVNSLNQN
jgi:hypothetical protein